MAANSARCSANLSGQAITLFRREPRTDIVDRLHNIERALKCTQIIDVLWHALARKTHAKRLPAKGVYLGVPGNPVTRQRGNLQQHSRNGRGQKIRQRSGEHRTQSEAREVAAPRRGERADASDLNGNRGEVREAAQRIRRDDEAAPRETAADSRLAKFRERHELVEHHARPEKIANGE